MYAVAFDLVVSETEKHHPKGITQAYTEIASVLGEHGFSRVQGSL
jgi:virulence-associated protein VapD